MKRSEMIKKFIEKTDQQAESGVPAPDSKEELTDMILTIFEESGMLPPLNANNETVWTPES